MKKPPIKKESEDEASIAVPFYRNIFDNAPIGIYTINKDGIIDSFNPSMLQITGAKNISEVLGLNALELPSYQKSGLAEFFRKGLGGESFTADVVHYVSYTANKKTVRNYKGVPIKNDNGTVERLLLFVEDITEKDKLNRQLNGLINNSPEGILIEDENRKITYVNQGFCKLFGINIPSSALIGNDCYQASQQSKNIFVNPDEFINRIDALLRGKKTQQGDELMLVDGRVFERGYTPVFSGAEFLGNMWTYRDITERQKIGQMKTDIISLVSHQIKTPLAELKGYVDNMLDGYVGNFSEAQISYLQDMKNIVGGGYKLVSDLLDLSKLERGVFDINLNPLNLSKIVKDLANEYKKPIEDKGLAFKLVSVSEEMEILADADKLKEALRNIINNAIKFTSQGSIILEQRKDDKFAILVIRDTGTGITPEKMGTLFKKEKILSGKPVAGAGAGLGLYIAKRFIELQNGTIEFNSQVGQGTEVTIKIPTHQ